MLHIDFFKAYNFFEAHNASKFLRMILSYDFLYFI